MNYHHHLGVYAWIERDGQVLLIRKARGPYTGLLDLPGGSLEPGELLVPALGREVSEETGYTMADATQWQTLDVLFPHQDPTEGAKVLRHIGVIYRAEVAGVLRGTADGLDAAGAAWYPLATLLEAQVTPMVWQLLQNKP